EGAQATDPPRRARHLAQRRAGGAVLPGVRHRHRTAHRTDHQSPRVRQVRRTRRPTLAGAVLAALVRPRAAPAPTDRRRTGIGTRSHGHRRPRPRRRPRSGWAGVVAARPPGPAHAGRPYLTTPEPPPALCGRRLALSRRAALPPDRMEE